MESPTRDEWGCNIENAFDNQIRITRSMTGRVAKCGDDGQGEVTGEEGGAFGGEKGGSLIKNLSRAEGIS